MVMKYLIFAIFIFLSLNSAYAQDTSYVDKKDFNTEIQKINDAVIQLKKSNADLKNTVTQQNKKIDTLQKLIETREEHIQKNVDTVKRETQIKILDIDQKISVRTVLWIVITIIVLLVCAAVYIILRKTLLLSSRTLDEQIVKTRETIETEGVKLDNKLIEVLETQLQLIKNQPQATQQQESEIDHSLALRVGEEIHRMRKRIENMPEDTKGLGALKNSLMRLEEEFNDNGYEIVDLLGKTWNDGLTVEARFVPSDDLKPGEEIITKIIKPQINFKGVLIKAADIEVSSGG
jgi:predicted  nucleic acid-binding Zn-ribbon protein